MLERSCFLAAPLQSLLIAPEDSDNPGNTQAMTMLAPIATRQTILTVIVIALFATSNGGSTFAQEANASQDFSLRPKESITQPIKLAIESEFERTFRLTQEEMDEDTEAAEPPQRRRPSRSQAIASRRRRQTYRLPSMFGDFYGGGSVQVAIQEPASLTQKSELSQNTIVDLPIGGAVRQIKISENNSPLPRTRFLWNYNYFSNVAGGIGEVHRNTAGFEQAFLNGLYSLEFRAPFAATLDADQFAGGPQMRGTEFGNVSLTTKAILLSADQFISSIGVGLTLPTAQDSRLLLPNGMPVVHVQHQSVHLLPYLAMLHSYDSNWYWQAFLQLDVPLNGDRVKMDATGTNPTPAGVWQDPTVMFAEFGVGRWLFGNPQDNRRPAIAATAELHYATTLQDADYVTAEEISIVSLQNRYDVLNLTIGANIALNSRISIRPAFVIPLHDDQFDYEAMVQANIFR